MPWLRSDITATGGINISGTSSSGWSVDGSTFTS
jgi:hypothetical protein